MCPDARSFAPRYARTMRTILIAAITVVGCYVPPPVSAPDPDAVPEVAARRPLVTDQLPYLLERDKVRAWHDRNDWCLRRTWPNTDEFAICNHHPYLNRTTPAMYSMARYDAEGRTIAYATFTPVPCRMYGRCDEIFGRTLYASERDFVDHTSGLDDRLADRGRDAGPSEVELPSMQMKMFDALAVELRRRFGTPLWQDPHRFGARWETRSSEIGLFVAGRGGWVVETHEMRVPSLTSARL
jgi:hypothetical protein